MSVNDGGNSHTTSTPQGGKEIIVGGCEIPYKATLPGSLEPFYTGNRHVFHSPSGQVTLEVPKEMSRESMRLVSRFLDVVMASVNDQINDQEDQEKA